MPSSSNRRYNLSLEVGNVTVICTREENITIPDEIGYLECPDPDKFCARANPSYCEKSCVGRGLCVEGVCRCSEGWGGADCGLRSYVLVFPLEIQDFFIGR